MDKLEILNREIDESRTRAQLVLTMAEIAIAETELVDEFEEMIEKDILDSQVELEEAISTLRVAGLLQD